MADSPAATAAAPAASTPPATSTIAGIDELFAALDLAPSLNDEKRKFAIEYCVDFAEVDSIEELVDEGHADEFATALKLPGAKAKELKDALAAMRKARAGPGQRTRERRRHAI